MPYQFREIRKHEVSDVIAFAGEHGLLIKPELLRHNLSLAMKQEGGIVAAALCSEYLPGRYTVRFAFALPEDESDVLAHELADRVLRKMQAQGVGMTRVTIAQQEEHTDFWQQVDWLEGIQPVLPPGVEHDPAEQFEARAGQAEEHVQADEAEPHEDAAASSVEDADEPARRPAKPQAA